MHDFVSSQESDVGGTTVHIWLRARCTYPNHGSTKLTEPSFKQFTQNFLGKIANHLSSPIMLSVQMASKFFGSGGIDSKSVLIDLALQSRRTNVIATVKARVWKALWSIAGPPGSPAVTGSAKNCIWAVIERQLCRERLLLLCAQWIPSMSPP